MTVPPRGPTSDESESPRAGRTLGSMLARLRRLKRLSGQELGRLTGMSQSKVSRIERDQTVPTPEEIGRLVEVLDAPGYLADDILREANRLREEIIDARAGGRRIDLGIFQQEIADLERTASTIRIFQPSLLPGLLQTDEYARAILRSFVEALPPSVPGTTHEDVLRAVDQRMQRQEVLLDRKKEIVLVFTEAVLQYNLCPPDVMMTQLRKIGDRAALENVTIGIVPSAVRLRYPALVGFEITDQNSVLVDLPTTATYARGEADIGVFLTIFSWYLEQAETDIDGMLDRYLRQYAQLVETSL